jgi:hypothetical protein
MLFVVPPGLVDVVLAVGGEVRYIHEVVYRHMSEQYCSED